MAGHGRLGAAARFVAGALAAALLAPQVGCAPRDAMMNTPALYSSAGVDIDNITVPSRRSREVEVFYATDRAYKPDAPDGPYPPDRARELRLGLALVGMDREGTSWPDLAAWTTSMERPHTIRMHLEGVDDFGVLDDTVWPVRVTDPREIDPGPSVRFAGEVNRRLAESPNPDIVIYVAPFKVSFDLASFTAAEFSHYLGRDGVMISYSWPTRIGTLDYFTATESAYLTANNLRIFLEYLARETNARSIHLMTYSAGARVVTNALLQLRLKNSGLDEAALREKVRIGQVLYCGPDIDADAFGDAYRDGIGDLSQGITIYTSGKDSALGMSRFIFGWTRLGLLKATDFMPRVLEYLERTDSISFVEVAESEGAAEDNGHGYFRRSPWVSSDILLALGLGLPPGERGLTRGPGEAIWRFPKDYRERVSALVDRLRD